MWSDWVRVAATRVDASAPGATGDPYSYAVQVMFETNNVPSANASPDVGQYATNHALGVLSLEQIVASPLNYAMQLSNSYAYTTIFRGNEWTNATSGTLSFWFMQDKDGSQADQSIYHLATASDAARLYIEVYRTTDKIRAVASIGGADKWFLTVDAPLVTNGLWYHVAFVHNGTAPAIYVNGSPAVVTTNTSTDLTVWWQDLFQGAVDRAEWGKYRGYSDYYFMGKIDQWVIATNLTTQFVTDQYTRYNPTNRTW